MLRVSTHGLAAAEAGLVRALVKLMGCSGMAPATWDYVAQGPCDALVADAKATDLDEVRRARGCRALLVLGTTARNAAGDAFARPLQAPQFERWLYGVQSRLQAGDAARRPAAVTTTTPRFKLRRWPPTAVIHGEPASLHMASHLSRRYMSVAELARLTHQDETRARAFVESLQGMELLDDAPSVRASGQGARALPSAADIGLIRSIRQRLAL